MKFDKYSPSIKGYSLSDSRTLCGCGGVTYERFHVGRALSLAQLVVLLDTLVLLVLRQSRSSLADLAAELLQVQRRAPASVVLQVHRSLAAARRTLRDARNTPRRNIVTLSRSVYALRTAVLRILAASSPPKKKRRLKVDSKKFLHCCVATGKISSDTTHRR